MRLPDCLSNAVVAIAIFSLSSLEAPTVSWAAEIPRQPTQSPSSATALNSEGNEDYSAIIAEAWKECDGQNIAKAEELFRKALKSGRCDAAYGLQEIARRFQFGVQVSRNLAHAKALFALYSSHCGQSPNSDALMALGLSYTYGIGTKPQYRTAVTLLIKAFDSVESKPGIKAWRELVAHHLQVAGFFYQHEAYDELTHDQRQVDGALLFKAFSRAVSAGDLPAQCDLAFLYYEGLGVEKDASKAAELYLAAAERGSSDAQGALGALYAEGAGVVKNYVEALKWFTVAAASGDEGASKLRDKLEMQLSPTQIAQAQQLAKLYVERRSKGNPASPKDKPKSDGPAVSGTAFFISSDGYLLTNYHVVKNYRKIVVHVEGNDMPARVVKSDIGNDLSILKVEGNFDAIPLGNVRDVSLGDSVMTIGFPNIEIQGTAPKLTKGEISALSGLQDDPRFFQISVPVQPGNSGGPLVDEHGNVIAVTMA
jgi:TPR repeat protein